MKATRKKKKRMAEIEYLKAIGLFKGDHREKEESNKERNRYFFSIFYL
jgi:hypothetical protein